MVKEAIKGMDMFGHVIQLNFDKQGETHNTLIGGCFSGFLKLFFMLYFLMNIKKLVLFEDDNINVYPVKDSIESKLHT